MGGYARMQIVCQELALRYPDGLTLPELEHRCRERDPERFHFLDDAEKQLGYWYGRLRNDMVICWRREGEKHYYDIRKRAYTGSGSIQFALEMNAWLRQQGLPHLILCDPQTPRNSTKCPIGYRWRQIPQFRDCNWNDENGACSQMCGLRRIECW